MSVTLRIQVKNALYRIKLNVELRKFENARALCITGCQTYRKITEIEGEPKTKTMKMKEVEGEEKTEID